MGWVQVFLSEIEFLFAFLSLYIEISELEIRYLYLKQKFRVWKSTDNGQQIEVRNDTAPTKRNALKNWCIGSHLWALIFE